MPLSKDKGGMLSSGTDVIHQQGSSWIFRIQDEYILKSGVGSLHARQSEGVGKEDFFKKF